MHWKRLPSIFAIIAIGFVLQAKPVSACTVPPESANTNLRRLVDQSKSALIGEVEAVSVTGDKATVTVATIERLLGRVSRKTLITIPSSGIVDASETDDDPLWKELTESMKYTHQDVAFWLGRRSAGGVNSRCAVVFNPKVGERYLIFLGGAPHVRAFERFEGPNDQWYRLVKQMIQNRSAPGRVVSPRAFLTMFYSIYKVTCGRVTLRWVAGKKFGDAELRKLRPRPTFYPLPNYCEGPIASIRESWVLFSDRWDDRPIAIPIINGHLSFGKQYGDLVLSSSSISLPEAELATLRRK